MKYQIVEVRRKFNHAGSKARDDVMRFAGENGYKPLFIKCRENKNLSFKERLFKFFASFPSWLRVAFKVKKNSVILLQNPFYNRQLGREFVLSYLKRRKKCKLISVVHDVEALRGKNWNGDNMAHEFEFMKDTSDIIIVHNEKMLEKFCEMGFLRQNLVPLCIFDYFTDCIPQNKNAAADKSDIVIAGNLNPKKCPYVYKLSSLKKPITVNLYGPNFEGEASGKIRYMGVFPSDEVPGVLNGKFGLIWDGDSLETCLDETGEYLKVNNPHKTSLYIVSGLPVVIWKSAAMADFIAENNIGITVDSIEGISEKISALSEEEYNKMKENTLKIREKLIKGYYLKTALCVCEKRLEKENEQ